MRCTQKVTGASPFKRQYTYWICMQPVQYSYGARTSRDGEFLSCCCILGTFTDLLATVLNQNKGSFSPRTKHKYILMYSIHNTLMFKYNIYSAQEFKQNILNTPPFLLNFVTSMTSTQSEYKEHLKSSHMCLISKVYNEPSHCFISINLFIFK